MKKTMTINAMLLTAVMFGLAAHAATINRVIVRQQWPWSTDVKVEYSLTGVDASHPVDLTVTAYNGDAQLPTANLASAIRGDLYGITEEFGEFYIDPVAAFGSEKIAMTQFKVRLAVSDSPANLDEALYRIYNLESPYDVTNVTRKDLLNGKWGSIERDFSRIGDGFNTTLDDVIIWTAVTNDVKYKTTHLVMRKIPAANKVWKIGSPTTEQGRNIKLDDETQHNVKLTQDYYIAVFETTQAQFRKFRTVSRTPAFSGDTQPMESVHYASLRGNLNTLDENGEKVNWPTNSHLHSVYASSDIGNLRSKFGGLEFDLPTEAQGEFACRAGTTNALNSGKEIRRDTDPPYHWKNNSPNFNELGWCVSNAVATTHVVGLKKPNAFGLYDMHGNVAEQCVNWRGDYDAFQAGADPIVNPTGPASDNSNRNVRGGDWTQTAAYGRSALRDYNSAYYTGYSRIGFRLVCPAVGTTW